jgi:Cd2+/Zn2+-exporting ATPase
VVSALAAAARQGVLIKGGAYLERLAAVRAVAFDKTGTLTYGQLHVVDVRPAAQVTHQEVLSIAAALEARSEHPVARAIAGYATQHGLSPVPASHVTALPGLGVEGHVAGRRCLVGNERLFRDRGISLPPEWAQRSHAASSVVVACDGRVIGIISVADRLRETAKDAVDMLRHQGVIRVAVVSGDHEASVSAVAERLGIDEIRAGLLPNEKHEVVHALRGRHGPVLMVGDGINDTPALAAADVGVAMGAASSDAALETADVALMSGELLKLPYAVRLARATLRNIRANVAVSLSLKAAFLVMAVSGRATLWMAILADTGATVIVVVNALRLLRAK